MAQLAIKGHATRGNEVIEILEMLGGKHKIDSEGLKWFNGTNIDLYYTIKEDNYIHIHVGSRKDGYIKFTLEEFLEKFPYKVGDKVRFSDSNTPFTISRIWWDNNASELICTLEEQDIDVSSVDLQPYKKETMDKASKTIFDANAQCCDIMNHLIMEETIKIDIPKGYEFAGVDDDNQQVVFDRIGCQYPKTYEECCRITNSKLDIHYFYTRKDKEDYPEDVKIMDSLDDLRRLIICRNAYWKIAGEQMRLGKPWQPNTCQIVYSIGRDSNKIGLCNNMFGGYFILEFPTEEMRDSFYENFKELIEQCKELL